MKKYNKKQRVDIGYTTQDTVKITNIKLEKSERKTNLNIKYLNKYEQNNPMERNAVLKIT